ncbi:hypothetical protein RB195_014855 [Necator americanus]|uniref:Ground-like domain-containing protein n=1 Tax=Necator americanus TaxID=51031 RepID=A0ABR1E350_NECAM
MLLVVILTCLTDIAKSLPLLESSLCCCGCISDPCPVVEPSCPAPKEECRSLTDLKCTDLQRLLEKPVAGDIKGNSTKEEENDSKSENTTASQGHVRLVTNNGLAIFETGSAGRREWKEVVSPKIPIEVHSRIIPQMLLSPLSFQGSTVHRVMNFSSFQGGSQGPLPLHQNDDISTTSSKVSNNKTAFEKLEAMVAELQQMLHQLKHSVMDRANERSDVSIQAEAAPSMDPVAEELEKKAIDDVITRMRGSFQKFSPGSKPVNEVDSSVSAAVIDVQSPLKYTPPHIRAKRATKDGGNCNDTKLKELILKNIEKDAQTSKRAIQKEAESEYGGTFNVICSPCEFSFVISSQKYCDGFKDQIACFVFLQPPTTLTSQ